MKAIRSFFNNRFIIIGLMPISIIWTLMSYMSYREERKIFLATINTSKDLTDKLMEIGFYGSGRLSFMCLRNDIFFLSDQKVEDALKNIKQNIVNIVSDLLLDYDLLGVTYITTNVNYKRQVFNVEFKPATLDILRSNIKGLVLSAVINAVGFGGWLWFF